MYLRSRSEDQAQHEDHLDNDAAARGLENSVPDLRRRQDAPNPPDAFRLFVETLAGGLVVTLTHAINDGIKTEAPAPISSSSTSSSTLPVITSASAEVPAVGLTPESSSTPLEALPETTSSSILLDAPVPSSTSSSILLEAPVPSSTSSSILFDTPISFSTSIIPSLDAATSVLDQAGSASTSDAQDGSGGGDAERLPAVGIAMGALAGVGFVVTSGLVLYKYLHKKKARSAGQQLDNGDIRQFRQI